MTEKEYVAFKMQIQKQLCEGKRFYRIDTYVDIFQMKYSYFLPESIC